MLSNEIFERQTEQQQERQAILIELVGAFAGANIPLSSLDNDCLKKFLGANLKNFGILPSAYHLWRRYLPKVFGAHRQSLKEKLLDVETLAVVCDETTDAEDRHVFNILVCRACPMSRWPLRMMSSIDLVPFSSIE